MTERPVPVATSHVTLALPAMPLSVVPEIVNVILGSISLMHVCSVAKSVGVGMGLLIERTNWARICSVVILLEQRSR